MNAKDRTVHHLYIAFMGMNNRAHEGIPDHSLSQSIEAIVDRGRRAIARGEIRPRSARAQHPEDAVEHTPVVDARLAARLVGKKRKDHIPFEIAQFVTSNLKTLFWEFESRPANFGNSLDAFMSLRSKHTLVFFNPLLGGENHDQFQRLNQKSNVHSGTTNGTVFPA